MSDLTSPAFDPSQPASTRIADLAKQWAAESGTREQFVINAMRVGIDMALHEIEVELMRSDRKTMHISDIRARFDQLRASVAGVAKS